MDGLEPGLADRIVAALDGVAGIALVAGADGADAVLVPGPADERESGLALTVRETEVLVLLAEGASNKEIARRLGISMHTAKFHVGSVMDKLDAVSRTDAVAHAARLKVIRL